jgi:hypothetical protein
MTELQNGLLETFKDKMNSFEFIDFEMFVEQIKEDDKYIYFPISDRLFSKSFAVMFDDNSKLAIPYHMLLEVYCLANEFTKLIYEFYVCANGVKIYHPSTINDSLNSYDWMFIKYAICSILIDQSPNTFKKLLAACDSLDDVTDYEIEIALHRLNKLNRPDITSIFMKYISDNTYGSDISL